MVCVKNSFLTNHLGLIEGVVLGEDGHALVEDVILVILDKRGAHAQAFLP